MTETVARHALRQTCQGNQSSTCSLQDLLTLASVPMQESLPAKHSGELLRHTLEELLDGGRVSDERGRHLESAGRNVAHGRLDVVRDPLDEVRAVLVLHVQQLLVNLL